MDSIGKYKLIRVIGEGGMGRVYEAMDPIIGRRVAIKTISASIIADAETRARFFREAQAAGQLSHPNLITIHDIGEEEATPYIVMEFLEGMDLNHTIRQERLSYDTKMQIMIEVCEGLAFAHGHDIVHRDIKPANIFLTRQGRVKILDFGLARGSVSEVTRTGKLLGTPNYMAPEQIRGDIIDHRADIFSTGVVFYELLSGRKAFEGDSIATTIYKVLETQPQPVHLIDENLPAVLSEIIDRALSKDRLSRFQSSTEMLDAILRAHGRTTQIERSRLHTAPLPLQTPQTATTPIRTSRSLVGGAIAAALAIAAVLGLVIWSRKASVDTPAAPVARAEPERRVIAPIESPTPAVPAEPPRPVPAVAGSGAVINSTPSPRPSPKNQALPETPRPPKSSTAVAAAPPRAPEVRVEPSPPTVPAAVAAPPPPEPVAAPVESPRAVAPPAAAPAPAPVVAPPVTPPARTEDTTTAAVQGVLARYRAALESRDITALKRIWPALSGRQEDAISNEFQHARAIAVSLDGVDIRPTATGATLTCRRTYMVTTGDGQMLKTATTMVMTLARRDGAWSIETIRHEVAR